MKLLFLTSASQAAQEVQRDTFDALEGLLSRDVADALAAFGLRDFQPESVFDVSLGNITAYFSGTLKDSLNAVTTLFFSLLALLMLAALARAITQNTAPSPGLGLMVSGALVLVFVRLTTPLLNTVLSGMHAGARFMQGYVPVFTALLSLSGLPVSAVTYHALVFTLSELVAVFCNSLCVSLIGCFFALLIANAFSPKGALQRFVDGAGKALTVAIGFISSVFAAVLGVRSVLSASLDSVSAKSTRFLIGSLIPVVGGSISEAYSAVLGSINLMKGSVAVVGMLVLLVLLVPPILEAAAARLALSALSLAASLMDCGDLSMLLRGFGVGVRFLLLSAVLELFALLIATGVMLSLKGGG